MRAGAFRDRVLIQRRTTTQVAIGETEVWTDVETRWARVVILGTEARSRWQQLSTEVTHEVHFRDGVAVDIGTHRFVWQTMGGRRLTIAAPPRTDGTKRHTVVAATEAIGE